MKNKSRMFIALIAVLFFGSSILLTGEAWARKHRRDSTTNHHNGQWDQNQNRRDRHYQGNHNSHRTSPDNHHRDTNTHHGMN